MTSEIHSSPEIAELAKAMSRVQKALTPACKDAENPFVKSRYATLNLVLDACREALASQSIWVDFAFNTLTMRRPSACRRQRRAGRIRAVRHPR